MTKSNLNMFGSRSISTLLFYITRIVAIGYSLFLLFILFALITGSLLTINGDQFSIKIPFSSSAIKGEYDPVTFIAIAGFMLFYALFFFLLSKIFHEFKGTSPFTKKAIRIISHFTRLNLFCAFLYIIAFIIAQGMMISGNDLMSVMLSGSDLISAMLHVFLGIFAWFIVIIFKRGLELQEDNNLTI